MISNVCKINSGTRDLEAILQESEQVAKYNGLNPKQTGQLRLLCEELDAMLPNVIGDFEGKEWIEFENGVCKINAEICFSEFTADKKKDLVNISTDKENACATGIVGKIRSFIEDVFLDETKVQDYELRNLFTLANEYSTRLEESNVWSLKGYKQNVAKEETEEWDKNILKCLLDGLKMMAILMLHI